MTLPHFDIWALIVSLLGAVALFAVFRVARRTVPLFTLSARSHRRIDNLLPVLELASWAVYLLIAAAWVLHWGTAASLALVGILFAVLVVVLYPTVKNVVGGLVMRGDRIGRLGDTISVGGVRGVVVRRGLRSITLEVSGGDQHVVPWNTLGAGDVVVHGHRTTVRIRRFEIRVPRDMTIDTARRHIVEQVLHDHWTTPAHQPRTDAVGPDRLSVTIHGLSEERLAELERRITAWFADRDPPAGPSATSTPA